MSNKTYSLESDCSKESKDFKFMAILSNLESKSRNGESNSYNSYDIGKYYVILPTVPRFSLNEYIQEHNAKKLKEGFSYTSDKNDHWIKTEEIRHLIKENLNIQID